jgi:CubicO group peptidase (beta-lactamase class C family)
MERNMARWILVFLLCTAGALNALSRGELKEIVDRYAANYRVGKHTPPILLVGVIYDDETGKQTSKILCYGTDRERISEKTLFRIGGVTEVFTATLLAKLVQEGLVKLDDPVQNYLPQGAWLPIFNGRQITLLDLATHTSGLPEKPSNLEKKQNYTTKEMYEFLSKHKLFRAPGTKYRYSPLGFALLSDVLSRVMQKAWQEGIHQKICDKLNLTQTTALLTPQQQKGVLLGHNKWGKVIDSAFLESESSAYLGADGLFSSAKDMLSWLAYNLGEENSELNFLLPMVQEPRCSMGNRKESKICLGWEMSPIEGSKQMNRFSKQGKFGGFGVYVGFVKESKTAVIVMTNNSHAPEKMGGNLLNALSGAAVD